MTRHYLPRFSLFILLCSLTACVPRNAGLSSFSKSNSARQPAIFSFFKGFGARKSPSKPVNSPGTYVVRGQKYTTLKSARGYKARGLASWYSAGLHNRRTSSGERYNMHALTAAHRTLPLQTYIQVKNLKNGRTVIVRVNDRGPFHSNRVVDLSYAAAKQLGLFPAGTVMVEIQTTTPGFFHSQTVVKPKPATAVITKARPKPQARPVLRSKPTVKPKAIAKPKPRVTSKLAPKAKPKVIAKPKPRVTRKPVPKAKPKAIVKPKPRVTIKPVPKAKPKAKAIIKQKAKIKSNRSSKTKARID